MNYEKSSPRTIKALCVVKKKDGKLSPFDVYSLKDENGIILNKDEVMCEVEIKFIKYHG